MSGFVCPNCNRPADTEVRDSRPWKLGVQRKRHCTRCRARFQTLEIRADQLKDLLAMAKLLTNIGHTLARATALATLAITPEEATEAETHGESDDAGAEPPAV